MVFKAFQIQRLKDTAINFRNDLKPRDSERGQSSYSPRNPSVPRGETINTALETSQTALRPRRGREGRDEEGREAPGPRAEASQAGPGATAGNKAPGMGSGKGRRARGWGLTRACRSSWEWRLEPFSRWTIRAMVRESPLSGSSIAARSGAAPPAVPAGGPLSPPHPASFTGVTRQPRERGPSSPTAAGWKAAPHRKVPRRRRRLERGSLPSAAHSPAAPSPPRPGGPALSPEPGTPSVRSGAGTCRLSRGT